MLAGRGRAVLNEIAAQDVSCDEASWRRWILRLRAGWPLQRVVRPPVSQRRRRTARSDRAIPPRFASTPMPAHRLNASTP